MKWHIIILCIIINLGMYGSETHMKDTVFREYDIRGTVGKDFILSDVYKLGCAIAYYFLQQNPNVKTIALGMDARVHSKQIKKDLCKAFIESGLDVQFVGICPSPAVYFAAHVRDVDASVMITASHNPKDDNGIKLMLGIHSLSGNEIRMIRDIFKAGKQVVSEKKGDIYTNEIITDYVESLVNEFKALQTFNVPFVIDCGNGAAGAVVPLLIEKMGWKNVQLLYPELDGTFPNHEANPVSIKNMQDVRSCLQNTHAEFGIGFDGDADRMAAMTKSGELLIGDKMLAIFAKPILQKIPGAGIVFNVVTSNGLIELLSLWGAKQHMSPVGHSLIEAEMITTGSVLGGETSGHFFFKDRHFGYDDGIYAMMRLIEVLHQTDKTLDELVVEFPVKQTSPEYRIACSEELKDSVMGYVATVFENMNDCDCITIDGIRAQFKHGWILIRKSNTQPVLSVRCEAGTVEDLLQLKKQIVAVLKKYIDEKQLLQIYE